MSKHIEVYASFIENIVPSIFNFRAAKKGLLKEIGIFRRDLSADIGIRSLNLVLIEIVFVSNSSTFSNFSPCFNHNCDKKVCIKISISKKKNKPFTDNLALISRLGHLNVFDKQFLQEVSNMK